MIKLNKIHYKNVLKRTILSFKNLTRKNNNDEKI